MMSCRVKVGNRIWAMSRKRFQGLLQLASEQMPMGIYAVEKRGYAELMNQKCASKSQLKRAKRGWKAQGY